MLSVWLVRHGQTQFSRANAFCGAIDPPLTDAGRAMAEALATRYAGEGFAAIYASPLVRTRETAAPLAARAGIAVEIDDGLREIAYGEWEGRTEEEVDRVDGERYRAWAANPGWHAPPGGETAYQIAARATASIARIRAAHVDGKVLVVTHKATLRVMVCALLGVDVNLFRARVAAPVGSLTVVDFKGAGPLLRVLGDTSHLPPELAKLDGT